MLRGTNLIDNNRIKELKIESSNIRGEKGGEMKILVPPKFLRHIAGSELFSENFEIVVIIVVSSAGLNTHLNCCRYRRLNPVRWFRFRSRSAGTPSARSADLDDDAYIYDEEINERHVFHEPTYVIS